MKRANIFAVAKKNLQQLKRDPRMIALSVLAPIIVTILFSMAFGGDLTNVEVKVFVEDKNFDHIIADEIELEIANDPKIQFNTSTNDPNQVKAAVMNNYTQAALLFPENFTESLLLGKNTSVQLYLNYQNPSVANYVLNIFEGSVNNITGKYFQESPLDLAIIPLYKGTSGPLPTLINISLSNLDEGWEGKQEKLSTDLVDMLEDNDTISIQEGEDLEKAQAEVKNGNLRGIIIIPEDFTYEILTSKEVQIEVELDGAEPQTSTAILGLLSESIADLFEEKFEQSTITLKKRYYSNPSSETDPIENTTYYTASILTFIVFFFSFLLTMLSFLRERTEGTMERLLTSPLGQDEMIVGYILSFSLVALLQSTVIMFALFFLMETGIEFSLFILLQSYLVIYLLVLAALGTGVLLSTLAKTEFQIIQFIPLVILPFMILSGILSPLETLPEFLQPISRFIPLTYAKHAMKGILLRGLNIFDVWLDLLIIVIYSLIMLGLGIIMVNRKIN